MRKLTLTITAQLMERLGLTDSADDTSVANAINNLSIQAARATTLQAQLTTATTRNTELETEVTDLKNAGNKEKVTAMLDTAITDKKITAELRKQFEKDYANNPDGLKIVLDSLTGYVSVVDKIQQNANKDFGPYEGKSWDDIVDMGKMDVFKKEFPVAWKQLYKQEFNCEPPTA